MYFPVRLSDKRHWRKRLGSLVLQFITLFGTWLVLSGYHKVSFIILGAVSAGLVTFMTHDLVTFVFERDPKEEADPFLTLRRVGFFFRYLPWLLSRIVMANVQVAAIVLNPRLPISPAFLQFGTRLKRTMAQVIVANSITLTPGTITVNLKDGQYLVHVLVPSAAGDILSARMQNKVGAFFLEGKEPPPEPRWAHSLEELTP